MSDKVKLIQIKHDIQSGKNVVLSNLTLLELIYLAETTDNYLRVCDGGTQEQQEKAFNIMYLASVRFDFH